LIHLDFDNVDENTCNILQELVEPSVTFPLPFSLQMTRAVLGFAGKVVANSLHPPSRFDTLGFETDETPALHTYAHAYPRAANIDRFADPRPT
jgi:hypothetical protein